MRAPCPSMTSLAHREAQVAKPESKLPVVLMTVICLVFSASTAIAVPAAADIIGIIGATVGSAMMFIIPAYAIGIVMPKTWTNIIKQVFLYFLAFVCLASVPVKVLRQVGML